MKTNLKCSSVITNTVKALADVQLAYALANFIFWSVIFACLAFFINRRLGCLGLTIGVGGLMFSAVVSLIGLLPWIEPTPFSTVPFPTLADLPSIPQPVLTCLAAAVGCFIAAYFIERKLHQRKMP
ncbi:MAG: hypothetical protein DRJ60_01720 [Thermoprotei archaeon]|nr:MAG: hypothetical protein DRJ60_01720 [Thermoprotei archaeon]